MSPLVSDIQKYDITTDEGYQNAIEVIAQARKEYGNYPSTSIKSLYIDLLDSLYTYIVNAHDEAVKEREQEKTEFEKLSETDQENVLIAVNKYLEKYDNASNETKNLASDILKDYTAWVINNTKHTDKITGLN